MIHESKKSRLHRMIEANGAAPATLADTETMALVADQIAGAGAEVEIMLHALEAIRPLVFGVAPPAARQARVLRMLAARLVSEAEGLDAGSP